MRRKFKEISKRAKWILNATALLVGPNFLAFWLMGTYLGGDALNGYAQGQHYFLCGHGACHEVSESIWRYSYWHAITAIGGIVLVFVEVGIFINTGDIILDFNSNG
jgi:hypothetical protein